MAGEAAGAGALASGFSAGRAASAGFAGAGAAAVGAAGAGDAGVTGPGGGGSLPQPATSIAPSSKAQGRGGKRVMAAFYNACGRGGPSTL